MPFVVDTATFVMINDFLIDVSISESHEFEAEVTDYPVESGANISDNIRSKPIVITMEGIVSNSPLQPLADFRVPQNADPTTEAYKMLIDVRDKREPVTIRTSLGTFTSMALQSLSIPRDGSLGDALRFTAKFQQIQTVTNKRSKRVAVPNGKGKDNWGQLLAKIKELGTIPVISFQTSVRAAASKSLGKPILSTTEGRALAGTKIPGLRDPDGRGPLDHYKVQGDAKLDGYVLLGVYYRVALTGGSETSLNTTISGTPVTYDYNKQGWVDARDGGTMVRKVPQKDRWKGVTVYNPKNGTGQTF